MINDDVVCVSQKHRHRITYCIRQLQFQMQYFHIFLFCMHVCVYVLCLYLSWNVNRSFLTFEISRFVWYANVKKYSSFIYWFISIQFQKKEETYFIQNLILDSVAHGFFPFPSVLRTAVIVFTAPSIARWSKQLKSFFSDNYRNDFVFTQKLKKNWILFTNRYTHVSYN